MKENTQLSLFFDNISGKKVIADFEGGDVTTDSGVLLLRCVEKRTGIIKRLCKAINDKRHQSYVEHELYNLLLQRIYQIACGYPDANDSDELRTDPGFKCACDRLPFSDADLASQPTMSRLENGISRTSLYRMSLALIDTFINSYPKSPRRIILDIDTTDDAVHGGQQLSLFNGYYDEYCFEPLHIYEGNSGKLVAAVLRPGKRPKGKEIVSILKRVVERIQSRWPRTKIIVRGDSHFSAPEVHDFCDSHKLQFVLGQSVNKIIKSIAPVDSMKKCYELFQKDIRFFEEYDYRAGSWSRPRRLIVKTSVNKKGADVRSIVTNITWKDGKRIYEKLYCARGKMENFIKNHKRVLQSDRTSCPRFEANQFRVLLHSIAYVLLHTLQSKALAKTELATAQFDTIQHWLLRVGAQVVERSKKVLFHLPSSYTHKLLFFNAHYQLLPGFT